MLSSLVERNCVDMLVLVQLEVDQVAVASLLLSLLEHLWGDVDASDVLEPSVFEIFTNKSGSASKVKNLSEMLWNHLFCGNVGDIFLNLLWVWVTGSHVDSFVVLSNVVKMLDRKGLVVLVVLLHFFDALSVEVHFVEIEDCVH